MLYPEQSYLSPARQDVSLVQLAFQPHLIQSHPEYNNYYRPAQAAQKIPMIHSLFVQKKNECKRSQAATVMKANEGRENFYSL